MREEDNGERFRGCLTGFNCEVGKRRNLSSENGRGRAPLEMKSSSSMSALRCGGLWISLFVTSVSLSKGSPKSRNMEREGRQIWDSN